MIYIISRRGAGAVGGVERLEKTKNITKEQQQRNRGWGGGGRGGRQPGKK